MLSKTERNIADYLSKRCTFLQSLIKEQGKFIEKAPEGQLRINHSRGRMQYFHKTSESKKSGTYIRKRDLSLACQLAQKEYASRVIKSAEKELCTLTAFLNHWPKAGAEEVFSGLPLSMRSLVRPFRETDDIFLKRWQSPYPHPVIDSPFLTARKENVRSKSEVIIADMLDRYGLPYRYEYPLLLQGLGTVHPDFTILRMDTRSEFYWEHFGMMDDPEYVEKALRKIRFYHENDFYEGQSLILTFESQTAPLDIHDIEKITTNYLL